MHIRGNYDAAQDRILLRLWGTPSGDISIWLTRRQWLAIAMACRRALTAVEQRGADSAMRKDGAGKKAATGVQEGAESKKERMGQMEKLKSGKTILASTVKFYRLVSGLRIEMAADTTRPINLMLQGEKLASFTNMTERLADRAKWDLTAARSRLQKTVPAGKRILH